MPKQKKVPSPTGKPSRVNPDVEKAMRGEGGKRQSEYSAPKKKVAKKRPRRDMSVPSRRREAQYGDSFYSPGNKHRTE